jgi:hypothetical protein
MLAAVRANKPAIIAYLQDREDWHTLEADHLLTTQGWVTVRCRSLGGARVLWVLDGNVKVPPDAENLPRYTWDEVRRIVLKPGLLRPLHAVRTFFPGTEMEPEKGECHEKN